MDVSRACARQHDWYGGIARAARNTTQHDYGKNSKVDIPSLPTSKDKRSDHQLKPDPRTTTTMDACMGPTLWGTVTSSPIGSEKRHHIQGRGLQMWPEPASQTSGLEQNRCHRRCLSWRSLSVSLRPARDGKSELRRIKRRNLHFSSKPKLRQAGAGHMLGRPPFRTSGPSVPPVVRPFVAAHTQWRHKDGAATVPHKAGRHLVSRSCATSHGPIPDDPVHRPDVRTPALSRSPARDGASPPKEPPPTAKRATSTYQHFRTDSCASEASSNGATEPALPGVSGDKLSAYWHRRWPARS